jgi:hypothetical protein
MRTHRACRRILLGCGGVFALLTAMVAVLEAQQMARYSRGPESILLMKNGAIVRGRILSSGTSYVVKQSNGEVVVPTELVHGQYDDLGDAYLRLKEEWPQPTADRHLALARWLVSQNMLSEARTELKSSLALEPTRDDIRDTLQKLNTLAQPATPAANSPSEVASKQGKDQRPTVSAFDDAESLGGLTRESATQFTRKVQPILMNNCMLAACHGPESKVSGFQLTPVQVGGGSTRVSAERNLAEVLKFVTAERPKHSPLVTRPVGNHGARGRPVFQGPRGADQLRELKKWVEVVAAERAAATLESTRDRANSIAKLLPDSQAMIPSSLDATEASSSAKPRPVRIPTNIRTNSPLAIPPVDEFDPDLFNRRHHGVAVKKD